MIKPMPHIAAMSAYSLVQQDPNASPPLSLSQNESLRPPSPYVAAAVQSALRAQQLYPDPDCHALRADLAKLHGLNADALVCSAGSLDLIAALCRAFAGPERDVVIPEHSYPFFRTAAQMAGARIVSTPEQDFTADINALLAAAGPNTTLVFLANPANPTGTHLSATELRRLRAGLPAQTLLVIDEAYAEFAPAGTIPSFDMVDAGNTVVLRSFSKAYGLASARVGWAAAPPDVVQTLRKVLSPNGVAWASQVAARAALIDQDYMQQTCALTKAGRDAAMVWLTDIGFDVVPSHTNFLLIDLKSAERCNALAGQLAARGILLRGQAGAGLPQCLRLTIGQPEAMDRVRLALTQILEEETA